MKVHEDLTIKVERRNTMIVKTVVIVMRIINFLNIVGALIALVTLAAFIWAWYA